MQSQHHSLGIDFGTSNTAAAYLRDGTPQLIDLAPGQTSFPTTFFFDYDSRETLMGHAANQALLHGSDGRFMRALKRVLGTTLMHQPRQILNARVTFVEIIAGFLGHVKAQAEFGSGMTFDHAISGRPVVFHGTDDPREAQAEADLHACYSAAGFKTVTFVDEPEAAAIASGALNNIGEVGLIVDIGGGTSDFSVFRSSATGIDILANHGVRIGGTDFDRAINIDRVMPLLGMGGVLRKTFGEGTTPIPTAIFNDLATWEKIPFVYTPQNRRVVDEMTGLALEADKLGRLGEVLDHELGHEVAFAVERGKIAANGGDAQSVIALDLIEKRLAAALPAAVLASVLAPFARTLALAAQETLVRAGIEAAQVDRVVYVGGSSLMSMVSDTMRVEFPKAHHSFADVFSAVAHGLALASIRVAS